MKSIWKTEISLEALQKRNKNTLSDFLKIEFVDFGDDYLKAKMPITDKVKQPLGIMHGGASCVLAETVGSVAANYAVNIHEFYCVGLDINTNHIRPIREGNIYAVAKPYHIGRTTQVWSIEIKNEAGQLISVTRLTMAVIPITAEGTKI